MAPSCTKFWYGLCVHIQNEHGDLMFNWTMSSTQSIFGHVCGLWVSMWTDKETIYVCECDACSANARMHEKFIEFNFLSDNFFNIHILLRFHCVLRRFFLPLHLTHFYFHWHSPLCTVAQHSIITSSDIM